MELKMREHKKYTKNDIAPALLISGKKLKNMDYTVNELAEILKLKPRYIREYLVKRKGAPTNKVGSEKGTVYINGKSLYEWAVAFHEAHMAELEKNKLKNGEFTCFRCRKHVRPDTYEIEKTKPGVSRLKAKCPICGSQINRYERDK